MIDNDYLSDEDFKKINYDELIADYDRKVANIKAQQEQQQQVPQEQNFQDYQYQQPSQEEQQQVVDNQPTQVEQQEFNNDVVNATQTTTQQEQQQELNPEIYRQTYEKIYAPFKANGKEFQVRNVDEAISLMQKGVDYTRKQQALKPRLVEMRTLEEQGMLGDNLNYAIDLYNGNPKAIAKLIKDKGIDINSLMPQQEVDEFGNQKPVETTPYTPNNYSISPEKLRFKEVVDQLKESDMYSKVDNALDDFDAESRNTFARNPNYYLVLSDLIKNGHYEPIKQELEHLQIVGDPRIRGLNYMDAFSVVANQYFANSNQSAPQQPQVQPQQNVQQSYQQQQFNAVQQRKQGASPVRSTPGRAVTQYDPLTCSDEEFAKIDINELMRR